LDITIIPGFVQLTSFTIGKVTGGDGLVGTADLVRLARFLAGHSVTIDEDAARVTLDSIIQGRVRTADLVRLARFLAGHSVNLGD